MLCSWIELVGVRVVVPGKFVGVEEEFERVVLLSVLVVVAGDGVVANVVTPTWAGGGTGPAADIPTGVRARMG